MVELRKLTRVVAAAIKACANVFTAVALALTSLAMRIEKRTASK